MEAFYKANHNTIYCLDFRKNDLPDESIQCVVTSPPYWGLRKYSGEQELIWGDNNCEHQWNIQKISLLHENRNFQTGTQEEVLATGSPLRHTHKTSELRAGFCSLCGAWKGAYGLEPTPEMYIEHTIEILREIRRVLRKDGVVFWNIGDSYTPQSSHAGGTQYDKFKQTLDWDIRSEALKAKKSWGKPKDLCLIPFRVAISAQNDGWWVRSVIIWSKPNPMPESVTDRPTESHEYILMLTKSGTTQYWTHPRKRGSRTRPKPDYIWIHKRTRLTVDYPPVSNRILKEFWTRRNLWRGHDYYWDADAVREEYQPDSLRPSKRNVNNPKGMDRQGVDSWLERATTGRNIRSVWEFPTQPYPEAHFAVFPEKLPEICIKAATPEVGCCGKCGAPWERVIKRHRPEGAGKPDEVLTGRAAEYRKIAVELGRSPNRGSGFDRSLSTIMKEALSSSRETLGWQPTCKCNADKVPSLVLDPLAGAGTTLWVAKKLNRYAVGYDTSEEYCSLAVDRCQQQVLL